MKTELLQTAAMWTEQVHIKENQNSRKKEKKKIDLFFFVCFGLGKSAHMDFTPHLTLNGYAGNLNPN